MKLRPHFDLRLRGAEQFHAVLAAADRAGVSMNEWILGRIEGGGSSSVVERPLAKVPSSGGKARGGSSVRIPASPRQNVEALDLSEDVAGCPEHGPGCGWAKPPGWWCAQKGKVL